MKNKSIDDATPEEWNRLNKKSKRDLAWLDESDDAANDHPVYGENIPDNRLGKSYSNLINTMVDHPPHYNNGHIECIEAIEAMLTPDEYIGYLRGNSLKYLWRFRYKNKPIEDLRKARWYEERLISYMLEYPSDK
jgi:hypothetical protein|tara:strand:+ start:2886 stop:3290 length:405 start_codon:yes stop_codon:yes gene_type:complete